MRESIARAHTATSTASHDDPLYKIRVKGSISAFCPLIIDGLVRSPKTPSPLMGEGGGEGDKHLYFSHFASPSPLSPPAKGGEM
jgi:hypothetical protein